jgi:hypothetical protein
MSLLPIAHAQSMDPSGSTYTNESVDRYYFYATGVTDSSSPCGCHSSSVSVVIRFPNGTTASSGSGFTGERAQTTPRRHSAKGAFIRRSTVDADL